MKRIDNDFYPTPLKLVRKYLTNFKPYSLQPWHLILEPCAGNKEIVRVLIDSKYDVIATDISDGDEFDATKKIYWDNLPQSIDWVFTNPPFNCAAQILEHALDRAEVGVIAIVRASFLEPCKKRRHLLDDRIRYITYVNPRPRFRADTKNTDSSTVLIVAWDKVSEHPLATVNFLTDWQK